MTSFTMLFIVLSTIVVVYKVFSFSISKYLWNKTSILKDIHLLSSARQKKFPGVAIVCGGSIAGLFAARVCANHFEKVLIIEPEEWVAVGEKGLQDHIDVRNINSPKRSRVAQYTAHHHFQLLITLVMSEMFGFQNFERAVKSIGGRLIPCISVLWMSGFPILVPPGLPDHSYAIYPPTINLTRPAFESILRRLVLQSCEEVQYFHGTVTGLMYDETVNRVTGVNLKLPNGCTTEIKGNIVIDATGSSMGGFRWLKALPRFSDSQLDDLKISFEPKIRYTTCYFALSPDVEQGFRKYGLPVDEDAVHKVYASLATNGSNDRFFVFEKKEKNLLQMSCGGYNWQGEIQDMNDLEDFLRQLKLEQPLPEWIYEMLNTLQSEDVPILIVNAKFPTHLPSNFVVVGDAQSQTDPILGQGCSKACATAIILNSHLHQAVADSEDVLPHNFAQRYFLDVKTRTEHIWINLKNIDYNFPSTVPLQGENVKTTSLFMRTYSNILITLATQDADISGVFLRQIAWLGLATDAFAPWLARRILWAWIKQLFGNNIRQKCPRIIST